MWEDFRNFALRGNVVDMAIGIVIGAAFGTIVQSLVNDILMPPVGMLLGNVDFEDLFLLLKSGVEAAPPYATLADAQSAGAVTINYGRFINHVVAFGIVALAMFVVVRGFRRMEERDEVEPEEQPATKACPYCATEIPAEARRCPNCTSQLDG